MILYIIFLVFYVGILVFIKPAPKSFRNNPITIKENFLAIKGTLTLGILLLTIHLFVSNFTFLEINYKVYNLLALSNHNNYYISIIQFFTNIFIHFNLMHLINNIFILGLLSAYERRVGIKRFLTVFIISGLFSGLSILFYDEKIATIGASGAIFGIGAAFFTDEKNLTTKDWIYAILLFLFLATIMSIENFYEMQKITNINFQIDYIAHAIGALGGILYTRIWKIKY